jgi:beta-N-acetylhexosaminidase
MKAHSNGRPTQRGRLALIVAAALLFGACGSPVVPSPAATDSPAPTEVASLTPSSSPSAGPSEAPSAAPTAALPSRTPRPSPTAQASCAQQVLTGMSLNQRIGELFSLGLANDHLGTAELSAIRNQHIGSVWFTATTSIGVAGIRAVTNAVQAQATSAATGGVRLFIAANQEGGQIQALRGAGFATIPSAVVQGGRSISTLTAAARVWGQELRSAGVNLDFAPVADVVPPGTDATNQPIGVLMREYGHDPTTAGSHAAAFIAGMARAGVDTTAKHFPGLGRVTNNTDFSAGVVDTVTTANDPYLGSFKATISAGVPFVMVALATYTRIDPAHLAAFSPTVIGLLRKQLGFRGVVVSDSLTAAAVSAMPAGQRAIDFLLAGGDLVVVRSAPAMVAMVAAVQARAATDSSFAHLVNEAALLMLKAKAAAGLLPQGC